MPSLKDSALELAEMGFSVIPLGSYGEAPPNYIVEKHGSMEEALKHWPKTPREKWAKYQDNPASEEKIEEWWSKYPMANIGILTKGLTVVDADTAKEATRLFYEMTPTPWRVRTGKGAHFYFQKNESLDLVNSNIAPGVDIRADGGYVVAPPSIHPSGKTYTWSKDDVIGCDSRNELPMLLESDLAVLFKYAAKPEGTQGLWKPAEVGNRNNQAAAQAGSLFARNTPLSKIVSEMKKFNQENSPPLDEKELFTTIASIGKTHQKNNPHARIKIEEDPPPDLPVKEKEEELTFPNHLFQPPGLVGEIFDFILETSVYPQPILALAASLTLVSVVQGRKIQTQTGLRSNLYTISTGISGSGKDHARKVTKIILKEAGLTKYLGGDKIVSDAGLIGQIGRQPSILFTIDEFGRYLEAMKSQKGNPTIYNITTALMEMFSSANSLYTGGSYAKDRKRIEIDQPNVCIYGTTVPEKLFSSLSSTEILDGFLPRFLVFASETKRPLINKLAGVIPEIPESIAEQIKEWDKAPFNPNPRHELDLASIRPQVLPFDIESLKIRENFEERIRTLEAPHLDSPIIALWARALENADKISLVLAGGEHAEEIQPHHYDYASSLVEYLTVKLISEANERVADSQYEQQLKSVLLNVTKGGEKGITQSELTRSAWGIPKFLRENIISDLLTGEKIFIKDLKVKGKQRPVTYYYAI